MNVQYKLYMQTATKIAKHISLVEIRRTSSVGKRRVKSREVCYF